MSEGPKLQSTVVRGDGGALVRLSGTIEADFNPEQVANVTGCLVLDLDGVTRITSFGVREWIRFLKGCPAEAIFFVNARPGMVAQFNLVGGFAGRGVLASCYLPYICEGCDTETEVLLDLARDRDVVLKKQPPPLTCPKCGAAAEFDDVPASYFGWMAAQPTPALSEVARRLLTGEVGAGSGGPLVVRKEVADAVTGLWLQGNLDARARFKRAVDGLEGNVVVVVAGLQNADADGAGRLLDLLTLPDATVSIARAGVDLLRALPKDRRAVAKGKVVSLAWTMKCETCGTETNGEILAPANTGNHSTTPARCTRCGKDGIVPLTSQQEVIVKFFLAPQVAPEVAAYLAARPGTAPPAAEPITSTKSAESAEPPSRYRVIRPLGAGGMAEVFLAEQSGPEGFLKKVVLKRILPNLSTNDEFIRMFLQEARTAARINHPNVVQIFDLGFQDKRYYMAMEYVRGWDLRAITNAAHMSGRPIPVEIACRIGADLCAGLHAAHTCVDETHKSGIIHRDVSPHNVLISHEGAVKITDFGISKVEDSSVGTKPGMLKGKIFYMAPEQIDGAFGAVDAASDVFAAGLVLREILSGVALFRRDNEYTAMHAVLKDPIPPLIEVRKDVSPRLSEIVGKALERDRTKRYATALALRLDLENELAASGRACTSAHLARWLHTFVAEARQAGSIGPPEGATPTGITGEVPSGLGTSNETADGSVFTDSPGDATLVTQRLDGNQGPESKKKQGGS
ncbi:MAG: protein kinase [Deltaproteobacteria bacterium]|nr:protein kinase [Deltaproteobacteria bacterium]